MRTIEAEDYFDLRKSKELLAKTAYFASETQLEVDEESILLEMKADIEIILREAHVKTGE